MKQRHCLLVKVNSEPVDANLDFRVWTIRSESPKQQDQSHLFFSESAIMHSKPLFKPGNIKMLRFV